MPTKIRLQRHGKKGKPFYHVVIADSRAPRDGKYIEKIGIYNPNTNPATIEVNNDKALSWLQTGAVPTNTVKAILKYTGVVYKHHLLKGVAKGAFSEADAENKFDAWSKEKEVKVQAKRDGLAASDAAAIKKIFDAESEINATRAKEIAATRIAESEALQMAENEAMVEAKADVETVAEAPAEVVVEAPVAEVVVEETPAEVKEEVIAEVKEEVVAEVKKVVAEVKEEVAEAPKAEAKDSDEKKD